MDLILLYVVMLIIYFKVDPKIEGFLIPTQTYLLALASCTIVYLIERFCKYKNPEFTLFLGRSKQHLIWISAGYLMVLFVAVFLVSYVLISLK
jgi:hypothetical protein